MLLKGIGEVEAAGRPVDAAEMVLVRIAYAADLPTPDEVVRSLGEGTRGNGSETTAPVPQRAELRSEAPRGAPRAALASAAPAASSVPMGEPIARATESAMPGRALKSFEDLIALAAERRDLAIKSALERDVRLVRFEDGQLELALEASARKTLIGELSKKLNDWTGRRWMVVVSTEPGAPSIKTQSELRKAELKDVVRGDPLVQAVLARFPGAEIVDVRSPAGNPASGADAISNEELPNEELPSEDLPEPPQNESDLDA
jgi:DNA polymerase III subunit gamma/tau